MLFDSLIFICDWARQGTRVTELVLCKEVMFAATNQHLMLHSCFHGLLLMVKHIPLTSQFTERSPIYMFIYYKDRNLGNIISLLDNH